MTPEKKKEWIIERTKSAIRDYRRTKFLGKEIDYSLLKNYKELNEEKDILTQEKNDGLRKLTVILKVCEKLLMTTKKGLNLPTKIFKKSKNKYMKVIRILLPQMNFLKIIYLKLKRN